MNHPQNENEVYEAVRSGELEIDESGRVWRLKKRTYDRWTGGVKTTPCTRVRAEMSNKHYLQVRMMRDGNRLYAAAHRLVWLHFRGPIPLGLTVNHKNGVKTDNLPTNLELATYSEQRIHAVRQLGAQHWDCAGEHNPKAQVTAEQISAIRSRRASGEQAKAIAASLGLTAKMVSAICRRRTWKHVT